MSQNDRNLGIIPSQNANLSIYQKSIYLFKRGFPNGDDHHHCNDDNAPGIFGPLTCSFLFVSALQKPGSDDRLFWPQSWKNIGQTIMIPIGLFEAQKYFLRHFICEYFRLPDRIKHWTNDICNMIHATQATTHATIQLKFLENVIKYGKVLHYTLPFFHSSMADCPIFTLSYSSSSTSPLNLTPQNLQLKSET